MKELYWITRLDGIHEFLNTNALIFTVLCVCLLVAWGIMLLNAGVEDEDFHKYRIYSPCKWTCIGSFFIASLFWLGTIFIPTTKEACMIYLGGSVVDYVQGNEQIQEMPDKVVNLATEYLDELIQKKDELEK